MSRITGSDALKMFEAYAEVYASQEQEITEEQVWEEVENWVNSLLEEGYDLSDYSWEEMYEEYLKEYTRQADRPGQTPAQARSAQQSARERGASAAKSYQAKADAYKPDPLKTIKNFLSSPGAFSQGRMDSERDIRSSTTQPPKPPSSTDYTSRFSRPRNAAPGISDIRGGKGTGSGGTGSGGTGSGGDGGKPKVLPAKPVSAGQTGNKAKDMATWAKANPKLAAAAAEKARIRGTAQTDNPLMKDMRSRMPVTPTVQSPAVAKLGAGNQSLTQNKFAGQSPTPPVKAATPSQAVAATTKPVAPEVKATNTIAAKPSSAMSQDAIRKQRLNMEMEYDAYDLVLEYLLSNGHVDTVDEAHYVMLEMDAKVIQDIVEEKKKWIQSAIKKPGALSKQLGVPEEENIPASKLAAAAKKGGKLGQRARLAQTLKGLNK